MDDSPPTPTIGVVTVSDRASQGVYEDRGGPEVVAALGEFFADPVAWDTRVVPDERDELEAVLVDLANHCSLVVTTGGTGIAPRDITPDATEAICDRLIPGMGEAMRAVARDRVPTSVLSRQLAGSRGRALIVNVPGSPKAIRECLGVILPAVPHAVELLGGIPLRPRGAAVDPGHP